MIGALLTWAGAAATTPALRRASSAGPRRFDRRAVRPAAAGDQPIRLPGHPAAAVAGGRGGGARAGAAWRPAAARGWTFSRQPAPERARRQDATSPGRARRRPRMSRDGKSELAILISGRGSNMMSLIAAARSSRTIRRRSSASCSNRPEAQGLVQGCRRGPADARHRSQELRAREQASRRELDAAAARHRTWTSLPAPASCG